MSYERFKVNPEGEASKESKQERLVFEKERELRERLKEDIEESERKSIEMLLNNEVEILRHNCDFMPEDEFDRKIGELENKTREVKPDKLKTEQEKILDKYRKKAPEILDNYRRNLTK